MVCSPCDADLETLLVAGSARCKIATQRPTHHTDPVRIDIGTSLQIIDRGTRPALAVMDRVQPPQPKRFADSGLVDGEQGDAALGKLAPHYQNDHFLHAIEPVAEDHTGPRSLAVSADEQAGKT